MPTVNANAVARAAGRIASRPRRGSVLILVVALVVLLALMGTAYLSSTSNERYTAAANTINAQADVVMQGVIDQTRDRIVGSLFDASQPTPVYRNPPTLLVNTNPYALTTPVLPITDGYHANADEQRNLWLASRVPTLRDDSTSYGGDANNYSAAPGPNLAGFDTVAWPASPTAETVPGVPGFISAAAAAVGETAYQFYNPATGLPVLSLGRVFSPGVSYNVGDIVSDGTPANRFYRAVLITTGNPLTAVTFWQPLDQVATTATTPQPYEPKQYLRFEPTFLGGTGVHAPAFNVFTRPSVDSTTLMPVTPVGAPIPAADADGDGAADAGYCLVPGGPINGITYYYATRVVDNAAALNADTAWSMTSDFDTYGAALGASIGPPLGYNPSLFPSNVGLAQLMYDYNVSNGISAHYQQVADYWFRNNVFHDNLLTFPYTDPITPGGSPFERNDIQYMTQGDELNSQLARRVDNPGFRSLGAVDKPFQTFTQADGLDLASRFCLAPADGSTNGDLAALLPELGNISGTGTIPTAPYDAAAIGIGGWFDRNFNFTADLLSNAGVNTHPLRAMVVARNGVSTRANGATIPPEIVGGVPDAVLGPNQTYIDVINPLMLPYDPPIGNPAGATAGNVGLSGTTYLPNQWVKYQDASGNWRVYRCLQMTTLSAHLPPDPRSTSTVAEPTNPYLVPNQYWALESWSPSANKTSVNTATFPELWRSFYNVMADKWDTAPNTLPDPVGGGSVVSTGTTGTGVTTSTTVATSRVGVGMFKSPLRYAAAVAPALPVPAALSDIQMVQLRSALAAAGAMALRNPGNDVVSRDVVLYDSPKVTARRAAVAASVFGNAKQPFITKVVVVDRSGETPPKQPWVAIELYNPYVELKYAIGAGEQVPDFSNYVTFHLGPIPAKPTSPSDRVVKTRNDIYLGCRVGVLTRGATGTLSVAEALDETGSVAASFATCPPLFPGQYLVLVSDAANVPTNVTIPMAGGLPTLKTNPGTTSLNASQSFEVKSLINLVTPPPTVAIKAGSPAPAPPTTITGTELVLYRTRAATGLADDLKKAIVATSPVPNVGVDPMQAYEETNIWDMVPFDQIDVTGQTTAAPAAGVTVTPPAFGAPDAINLYYRPTPENVAAQVLAPDPTTVLDYWKCVYPLAPTALYSPMAGGEMLQAPPSSGVPYSAMNPFPIGVGYNGRTTVTTTAGVGGAPPVSKTNYNFGVPWHVMQMFNTDWPCPHWSSKPTVAGDPVPKPFPTRYYPVSGFARNGDLMQVPFVGAYTLAATPVTSSVGQVLEVNSITMDALYAEDSPSLPNTGGPADDPKQTITAGVATTFGTDPGNLLEQVGRFCPLSETAKPLVVAAQDPYAWASRLYDYFTVQAPHDDYLPNADPVTYNDYVDVPAFADLPVPATNALGTTVTTANTSADSSAVQGLVNINTAPWRTLSMLPLVRYTAADGATLDGTVNVLGSAQMAIRIVKYRQTHGPFKSILDLNKVVDVDGTPTVAFQYATNIGATGTGGPTISFSPSNQGLMTVANVPDARQGILTPDDGYTEATGTQPYAYPLFSTKAAVSSNYGPNSGVYDDFQAKFLAFNRISNLITTSSDSYTCYVLVQGWQNGQVVSQRRSAFVIDRAPVGYQINAAGQRTMNTTPVVSHIAGG